MFRNLFFALVSGIVMIGCDSSDLILHDVLLTDADKGTLYINPDNVPSAYARYPAGDFTVDIPEDILLKIGSYNSGLFHGDRIYYTYLEYGKPYILDTVKGGGIVFCDRNGKYISHREIDFPRGDGALPRRYAPVTVYGIYDNHLIIRVIRYTDLYTTYDSIISATHIVKLNLDTFEHTWIEGYGDFSLFDPDIGGRVWAEFVSENILFLAKFDMQGNFTGEIVDIDSTCEDYQTYNRNVPMFPQDSNGAFLYFPAWNPNKNLDKWAWKPYKYLCYKRN